jgi:hypothetical protein
MEQQKPTATPLCDALVPHAFTIVVLDIVQIGRKDVAG